MKTIEIKSIHCVELTVESRDEYIRKPDFPNIWGPDPYPDATPGEIIYVVKNPASVKLKARVAEPMPCGEQFILDVGEGKTAQMIVDVSTFSSVNGITRFGIEASGSVCVKQD